MAQPGHDAVDELAPLRREEGADEAQETEEAYLEGVVAVCVGEEECLGGPAVKSAQASEVCEGMCSLLSGKDGCGVLADIPSSGGSEQAYRCSRRSRSQLVLR